MNTMRWTHRVRQVLRNALLFSQARVLALQFRARFLVVLVDANAFDRANLDTLRRVKMPDAFGTAPRVDDVDFDPLRDCAVGAFRLADIAVDTLVGNEQCHDDPRR